MPRRGTLLAVVGLLGALAPAARAADLPPGAPPPPAFERSAGDPICGPVVPRPGPPVCPPALAGPANPLLAALIPCETGAGGGPAMVDGRFEGLYQFTVGTWRSVGGAGHPARASAGEQHYRAWLLWLREGLAPWPSCAAAARAATRGVPVQRLLGVRVTFSGRVVATKALPGR